MGVPDQLEGAIALLRRGYCIGPNAKDAKGVAVRAIDPNAVCWSIYGALLRVTGGPRPDRGVIYGAAVNEA